MVTSRAVRGPSIGVLAAAAAAAVAVAGCGAAEQKPRTRGPSEATFTVTATTAAGASEPKPRCRPAPDQPPLARTRRDVRVAGLDEKPKTRPRTLVVAREIKLSCLVWTSFGGATASASGIAEVLDCVPTCAQSASGQRAARVAVSDLRSCSGRRFYSRVRLEVGADDPVERPRGYLTVPCTPAP